MEMTPFLALLAIPAADPSAAWPVELTCPAADPTVICEAEAGPNHAFLYAFPAVVRTMPTLFVSFRRSQSRARENFEALIAEARSHPEARYFRQEVYTVDANRPELLAFAVQQVQQAGDGPVTWSVGSVIWDRRSGQMVNFEDLFEVPDAGRTFVNGLFCGALRQARDASLGGGHQDCPDLYFARLLPGSDGRVSRVRLGFDPRDGLDDGQFDVEFPVTAELIARLRRLLRAAFAPSDGPVTACHRASAGEPCR